MERPIRVDEIDGLWPYLLSIDWSDPWFRYLLLFHVLCSVTTIFIRNKSTLQYVYFVILLMLVFFSENLNEWAAKNYKLFSRQQYFDSNGLFISTVFSTPILINCLVMVVGISMISIIVGNLFYMGNQIAIKLKQKVIWLFNMSKLMSKIRYVKHKNQSDKQTTDNKPNSNVKKEKDE